MNVLCSLSVLYLYYMRTTNHFLAVPDLWGKRRALHPKLSHQQGVLHLWNERAHQQGASCPSMFLNSN